MDSEEREMQAKKIDQLGKITSRLEWIIILMSIFAGLILLALLSHCGYPP